MDTTEAANILRAMYLGAPKGEKVTRIHLFGIKYASELESISLSDLNQSQSGMCIRGAIEIGLVTPVKPPLHT